MQLLGKPLRVARPNDYTPAPAELVKVLIPASVSATVTSSSVPGQATGMIAMLGGASALTTPTLNTALATGQVGLPGMPGGGMGGALGGLSGISGASLAALTTTGNTQQNQMALSRRARRLHVGNLPIGVGLTTDMLKQFFNAALVSANLHDTSKDTSEPVIDAMLGTESKVAPPAPLAATHAPVRARIAQARRLAHPSSAHWTGRPCGSLVSSSSARSRSATRASP